MSTPNPHVTERQNLELLHEESSVQVKPVLIFALMLVIVSVATFMTVRFLLDYFNVNQTRTEAPLSPFADPQPLPPMPRLQVSSGQDLRELRAAEDKVLNGYRWVDKQAGIVGIPVNQAMEILAKKGLPVRDEAKAER